LENLTPWFSQLFETISRKQIRHPYKAKNLHQGEILLVSPLAAMVRGQKLKAIVQAHIKQVQMVALSRAGLEVQAKSTMGQKEIYQDVLAAYQRHLQGPA
jgi:hypothetical protein